MIKKTVIITGASGGIGGATAEAFAKAGYNLALTYNSHEPVELLQKLKKEKVDVKAYKLNISDATEITKVFGKIFSNFDYVDCLVANAGISERESMLIDKDDDEIKKIIDTNLLGTIVCNRECLKHFLKQKHGNIVNISSIQGKAGSSCNSVYASSKAGIIALTQSLAREVGSYGIRINAVAPGFINTNMTAGFSQAEKDYCQSKVPLGRLGESEDVASAILFLASDSASYITGEILSVNGGVNAF